MGDLCPMSEGDLDKNGKAKLSAGMPLVDKEGKPKLDADGNEMFAERDSTSWDTISYLLYMGHSVFNHIDAVQEANRLADVESFREVVDYKTWKAPAKKSSKAAEVSPYVPVRILMFQKFAEDFFNPETENPREMLSTYKEFLDHISLAGEDDGVKDEILESFFEF